MRGSRSKAALVLVFALGACGGSDPPPAVDAGPPPDARPAEPDATPPVREHREIVGAGGRVRGGNLTMDVQLGHAVGQQKLSGGTLTLEGAAVVKP